MISERLRIWLRVWLDVRLRSRLRVRHRALVTVRYFEWALTSRLHRAGWLNR